MYQHIAQAKREYEFGRRRREMLSGTPGRRSGRSQLRALWLVGSSFRCTSLSFSAAPASVISDPAKRRRTLSSSLYSNLCALITKQRVFRPSRLMSIS
jgi:hypothetical protein